MAWELNTISSVVLSLLHHTDAVAVLFLLVEGSAMLALSSHPTHLLPRSVCVCVFMCLCECVCVCVFVLGNDAAPVCVNLSATELKQK